MKVVDEGKFHSRAITDMQRLIAIRKASSGDSADALRMHVKKILAYNVSPRLGMVLKSSQALKKLILSSLLLATPLNKCAEKLYAIPLRK